MSLSWGGIRSRPCSFREKNEVMRECPLPPACRAVVVRCARLSVPAPPVLSPCHGTVITGGINTRRCLCTSFSPRALFSWPRFWGVPSQGRAGAPRRAPWQQHPEESTAPGCAHVWDQRDATSSSLSAVGFKSKQNSHFSTDFWVF